MPELIQTVHTVPAVSIARRQPSESSGELLAIPVFEKDDFASVSGLDAATGGEVSRAFQSGEFTGKLYDLFFTPAGRDNWRPRRVVLIGAGPRTEFSTERLRRIATTAGLAARQRRVSRLSILHRQDSGLDVARAAQAMAEGILLANFDGAMYKTDDQPRTWLESAELVFAPGRFQLS